MDWETINELLRMNVETLTEVCNPSEPTYRKQDMINNYLLKVLEEGGSFVAEGIFDQVNDKWGFLRYLEENLAVTSNDIYVSHEVCKQFHVKVGDLLKVEVTKYPKLKNMQVKEVLMINERSPELNLTVKSYRDQKVLFPNQQAKLSVGYNCESNRLIDIVVPVAYGQRCLAASIPRGGKTSMMEGMAKGFVKLGKAKVMMLMISERPEEYFQFTQQVPGVLTLCSSFDELPARHVKLASLTVAYALRQVEIGHDVVLFIDSLTRYVRAVNLMENTAGKILTGGLDSSALIKIKQILGAARRLERGSLTIVASMLINTGSRMDDIIYEESKGTSNCDIVLADDLANKHIYPAMDIVHSATRRTDLILSKEELWFSNTFRQLVTYNNAKREDAMRRALGHLRTTKDNKGLLDLWKKEHSFDNI